MDSQLTPPIAPPPAIPPRTIYKLLLLLAIVGGIAYSNSFTKGFFLDDVLWITNNQKINDFREYVASMSSRPFIPATLYVNHRLHGLSPFGYHLVNLFIHLAAALALFGLVRRTLLLPRWDGRFAYSAHWLAFAVALLWVVHPLQTQAVTYVIQRCESMMGLFYLLTMYCMLRGSQAVKPWPWYLASWVACVVGAGSKEVMVTVLPMLLCFDRVFIGSWKEIFQKRWWYYLGIAAIWGLPFLVVLPSLLEASPNSSAGFNIPHLRPPIYWMTQTWVILHYLHLCIVPYPQSFLYRGWAPTTDFADCWPAALAIALMLLGIAWLCWRRHWIGFLGFWFFGILSITSFVPLLDVAFEHRLYLPLAAFCALIVLGGYALFTRFMGEPTAKRFLLSATVVLAAVWGVMTYQRNQIYQNACTLWADVLAHYPNDQEAVNNYAIGLEDLNRLDEAIAKHQEGHDGLAGAYNLGNLLCRRDEPEKGIPHILANIKTMEGIPGRSEQIATREHGLGRIYWIQGDLKTAEMHLKKSLELSPNKAETYYTMGLVQNDLGQSDLARASYQRGLQLNSNVPRTARGVANYFLHGYPKPTRWSRKEALFYAKQAAQANDYRDPPAVEMLIEAYAVNGMYEQADELTRRLDAALQPEMRRVIAYYRSRKKAG